MRYKGVRQGFVWGVLAGFFILLCCDEFDLGLFAFVLAPTVGLLRLLPDPARFRTAWIDIFELLAAYGHILLYGYLGLALSKMFRKRATETVVA